ncbi:hypothetical protein RintRC_3404 [Richelia intracellularis]|nr:hypothetical protein RintRC_3404 [Richelia intracellularis]
MGVIKFHLFWKNSYLLPTTIKLENRIINTANSREQIQLVQ